MGNELIDIAYLLTAVTFMLALKLMNSPKTARQGNLLAAAGMALAVVATLFLKESGQTIFQDSMGSFKSVNVILLVIAIGVGSVVGVLSARKVQMTAMPQMVALFNGLGGGAVALVALVEYPSLATATNDTVMPLGVRLFTTILSLLIGLEEYSQQFFAKRTFDLVDLTFSYLGVIFFSWVAVGRN